MEKTAVDKILHSIPLSWLKPQTTHEAIAAQREMVEYVKTHDDLCEISYIAGLDVSNTPHDQSNIIYGSCVLLSFPDLNLLDYSIASEVARFPYIPGLLGFREVPILVEALLKLKKKPDLLMVDGHGISHPRGFGIASHIGLLVDIPSIGIAKNILVGQPLTYNGINESTPLVWKEKQIGLLLKTRKHCNPIIISCGHKISLQTAVTYVQQTLRGYKLPEPIRLAHIYANKARNKQLT